MSYSFDATTARQADRTGGVINQAGKYVGTITRAEKLTSKQGTRGIGISFKSDDGASANYLDLYTENSSGDVLPSMATVQAILCCTKTREAAEGPIEFDKWDKDAKQTVKTKGDGYPSLMGKRVGLLLQKELATNTNTGADTERMIIYGVFSADTELTASEILDKKTEPEKLSKMVQSLMAKPVNDRRNGGQRTQTAPAQGGSSFDDFDDDIPF